MGIYLPNMEMPKSCAKCTLFGEYGCPFIGAVGYALTRGERNEDCPLVPVPPHGRLIDADALEDDNITYYAVPVAYVGTKMEIEKIEMVIRLSAIDNAPTIIPAEEGE